MVIDNKYEISPSSIVSVGYTDISTGKSRTNLYAGYLSGALGLGAGREGVISNVPFYAEKVYTSASDYSEPLFFDMDFDIPQTIDGFTIIQVPFFTNTTSVYFDVGLSKIDVAGVQTGLASGATIKFIHAGFSGAYLSKGLDFPKTTFKNGEKLRLKIVATRTGTDAVNVGADPMSRDWGYTNNSTPTKLVIQAPFKVDL